MGGKENNVFSNPYMAVFGLVGRNNVFLRSYFRGIGSEMAKMAVIVRNSVVKKRYRFDLAGFSRFNVIETRYFLAGPDFHLMIS